jgi:hypothetical protein
LKASKSRKSATIFAGSNRFSELVPTKVYDSYWRFAAERQAIFMRRLVGEKWPWTSDPILRRHKFTNAYRASDRVSQFLIRNVLYADGYSDEPVEVFFRTLLFKLFNKVTTWQLLETSFGKLTWKNFDFDRLDRVLTGAMARGDRLYSPAYIIPPVRFNPNDGTKHRGHLSLVVHAMQRELPHRIAGAAALSHVYEILEELPSFGPFLAFQLAIDLNYSEFINFEESDFVVAGPGALDGISKCFLNASDYSPCDLIEFVQDRQEAEFERLGVKFDGLWGRSLQLIDCQNLFCEISKYARVAHPEIAGVAGRTRIKQSFSPALTPLDVWYPPKWGLNDRLPAVRAKRDDLFATGAKT